MAGSAVQYSQLGDFASSAGQYQPYPYNSPAFANDQYPSASLPQAQVHNFIQSPPAAPPRGQTANQPRFGERTVARPSGRRRKQPAQRGPIVTKDGGDSVVPLYSYQTLKNNTVVQVPIFWTALNIALGYQVQADQVIRGLPCIKRLRQLFCTNAGSQYPTDRIESFINENKALTRRMFGTFPPPPPDLGNEVSTLPEMEPFETVDFTTEPYPLDTGFTGEGLTALEAADLPLTGPSGSTGGSRGELRRVGRDGGTSGGRGDPTRGGRGDPTRGGRGDPTRGGRGDPARGARGDPTRGGRGDPTRGGRGDPKRGGRGPGRDPPPETVVETPPTPRGTERSSTSRRTSGDKYLQGTTGPADFWQTAESAESAPEKEEVEENFVNVDAKGATPAVDAAGSGGNSTNSTETAGLNATDITGPSGTADNFTKSVEVSTEPDLPPYFDETGPSAPTGRGGGGFVDSPRLAGRRPPFDSRQDFLGDRRGFPEPRGFADPRRKPRRRGAGREVSRRLTDALADTAPSAWSARSARARPRHLRHSFPAEPRPPANQVPAPADVKPTEPISVATATTARPAPPIRTGGPYVALKVKGCSVLAPSVNRQAKHKLPVTPANHVPDHAHEQPFPRAKRSADNDTMSAVVAELNRQRRQAVPSPPVIDKGSKHLVDSCESKVEIVTPYWAANSAGEIRAIVNTKHFPQAIHQEICKGTTTSRCTGNCLCEQKYTYHRLLSYDPDNDCKGIFIDWFLFPSCCACRCPP